MNCPTCTKASGKFGKTRDGQQRYRCADCRKTFSEPKPLAGIATDMEMAAQALSMLLEGMSIRATARLTGPDKNTIQRIMEQAGAQCLQFMADTMRNLNVNDIQCDEVWSFVGMKERTAWDQGGMFDVGDAYVFTAIDRPSKLVDLLPRRQAIQRTASPAASARTSQRTDTLRIMSSSRQRSAIGLTTAWLSSSSALRRSLKHVATARPR